MRRSGNTHYSPNTGTSTLRKAIQRKLQSENGLEYGADEIVLSNGAKQSIWQSLLATCSPGDEVRAFHLIPLFSFAGRLWIWDPDCSVRRGPFFSFPVRYVADAGKAVRKLCPLQVLIPAPYWVSYPEMARLAGASPVFIDCPADQGYVLTAQQLRAALNPRSRLLILCTPSNPTGAVYSLERLKVLFWSGCSFLPQS